MVSEYAPRVRKRRVFARLGFALGAVALIGTTVAFTKFFARPGEDALRLIPSNALVFGSADLSPSPGQTLVFKKIDDALSRNGLDEKIDGALTDLIVQGPAGEKIRPYSKRGVAFAMLPPANKEKSDPGDMFVAYFALSDGPEVAKILKQHGKPAFWRGTRFHTMNPNGPGMMVVEDLLVVGMGPALHQVELVSQDKQDNILERPDFDAERSKIDPDSNLMVFMAPEAWSFFAEDAPQEAKKMLESPKWLALGLAIRDGGIALSFNGAYDANKASWLKPFTSMAPLRNDLLSVLPKGAYGFTALAQPSKYFESFEQAVGNEKEGRKMIAELEKEMSKEMSLSVRQDILPAFQGNAILGLYPNASSEEPSGIDLLLVVDDKNGAKASALAERLRERLEQELMSEGEENPFDVKVEGDVKRYTLIDEASAEIEDGLAESIGADGPFKASVIAKDKTITWALVGQTVIASSSTKLLDQAIAGIKGQQQGLEADTRWQGRSKDLVENQQIVTTFNIARIVQGFQNSIDMKKWGDDQKEVQEVVDVLKGLNEPFALKSSTMHGNSSLGLFIPMDYEKLIDMIGKNVE